MSVRILQLAQEMREARRSKDWPLADEKKAEILSMGRLILEIHDESISVYGRAKINGVWEDIDIKV